VGIAATVYQQRTGSKNNSRGSGKRKRQWKWWQSRGPSSSGDGSQGKSNGERMARKKKLWILLAGRKL
jgi:hypothetical protein